MTLSPLWLARGRESERIDAGLSVLLLVQALTLFVVLPLGAAHPRSRVLLDICHLAFAAVCVRVLTTSSVVRAALLGVLASLAFGPVLGDRLCTSFRLPTALLHEGIAVMALMFNVMVTALVARQVFASGRVNAHRVRGAVLLYLNVAALFAITYGLLLMHSPGAIVAGGSNLLLEGPGAQTARMTYFSLSTITTTGYGDVVPVYPLARSLADLEAVFGQLFPATLLARLVALHLAHERALRTVFRTIGRDGPSRAPIL